MLTRTVGLLLLSLASACCLSAQTKPTDASYKDDALIGEKFDIDIRFAADGTGERVTHAVMHAQNEAGARALSVLSLAYASANQEAEITGVRVHKPDGTIVETPSTDAMETPSPVTRQAPLYSDLKEKQLPVRSFSAGDTLEYTFRLVTKKAQAPDQFWGAEDLLAGMVLLSQNLTLHVPSSKYVQVWSPKYKPTVSEANGEKTYHWSRQLLTPAAEQAKKIAETEDDKLPDIAWTTFHSWAEVGAWYRSLAQDRYVATPELKARAESLTASAKTPEEKVKALYAFVGTSIRYVGIDLGIGRFQPHEASVVLANQYGDCKDKDTLLEAMLQAVGIPTSPALIGVNIDLAPDVPSPAFFNHVITTVQLPSGQVWLDATPELSPFRYLLDPLRDKQALVIPAHGDATLQKTPANPPYPLIWEFTADGTFSADASLTAQISTRIRSDEEVGFRNAVRSISPAQWDEASQNVVRMWGFGGTTSHTVFGRPDETDKPFEFKWEYKRSPYGDTDSNRIIPLLPYTILVYYDEKDPPKKDLDLGAPRSEVSISRITLPKGYGVDLPDAIHAKADFATFDVTYHFDNNVITTERRVVILQKKVPRSNLKSYFDFTKKAKLDSQPWIVLYPPQNTPKVSTSATKENSTTPAQEAESLAYQAGNAFNSGNRDEAKKLLEEAKKKSPDAPRVHALAGLLAMSEGRKDEAIKELRREFEITKHDPAAYLMLAALYQNDKNIADAEDVLHTYLKDNPGDINISLMLANLQSEDNHNDQAVETLQTALRVHPDEPAITSQIPIYVARTGNKNAAVDSARKMIAGSDDPYVLNNAADVLSTAGKELPLAESAVRKALEQLETESATTTISEANNKSFAHASLMVASWDTLGWILYQEGKTDEALSYLRAAWASAMHSEVGYHLGQALEKTDPKEAIKLYRWAMGSETGPKDKELMDKLQQAIDNLKAHGVPEVSKDATMEMQDQRTFHPALPHTVTGFATFRIQVDKNGIVAAQWVSGEEKMRALTASLKSIKLSHLVPAQSNGRILRDGVLSCHSSPKCDFVLMPNSNTTVERVQ